MTPPLPLRFTSSHNESYLQLISYKLLSIRYPLGLHTAIGGYYLINVHEDLHL